MCRLKCHRQKKYFPILTQNCPSAGGYHFSPFMGPFIKWNYHKPVDNILYQSKKKLLTVIWHFETKILEEVVEWQQEKIKLISLSKKPSIILCIEGQTLMGNHKGVKIGERERASNTNVHISALNCYNRLFRKFTAHYCWHKLVCRYKSLPLRRVV